MSRLLKLILVLLIFVIGLAFHLRNDQLIHFNYYAGSIDMPLSFFLVLALIVGALLGILACAPLLYALKRENSKLARQAALVSRELNNLRVIPIKDAP